MGNQQLAREVLDALQPVYWFHGHHHVRLDDAIGRTNIVGLAHEGRPADITALLVGPDGAPIAWDVPDELTL